MVVTGSDSNGCEPDFNQTLAREKTDCVPGRGIKILALMEADSVTGPAKNLIDFAERSLQADQSGACPIQVSIATFTRGTAFRESDHEGPGGRRTAAAPSPFVTAARHAGIEVNLVRERFRFDIGALSEIKKIVERSSSSVIQTHNVKSHFLVRVSGLWRSVPWVAFHHGYTATDAKMSVYNKLDRWSLKAAARVVTVSRAYARMLESSGVSESRIRVVHNSVDPARYRGAPKTGVHRLRWELGLGPAGRMVLAVGRLSREKAHVDLVDAFCRLVRRRPGIDLRLVIAGEGPERRSIEEAIVARGLAGQVVLTGHVADIGPYYLAADALALPSLVEGSPNVVLEAMAAGLPVVATRAGGIPEIIRHGSTGMLVTPSDPEAMAAALSELVGNPELSLELAENARLALAVRHSPDVRARALRAIYQELVSGFPAGLGAPAQAFKAASC